MKLTKAKKRVMLEIAIVVMVALALALMFFTARKPVTRTIEWQNPNKYSSETLIEAPKSFDGQMIDFTGEAVGERMIRNRGSKDAGVWIHLNDDAYMYRAIDAGASLSGYNSGMPVWVTPVELTDAIQKFGGYNQNGDVVKISGVFHAACAQHGGDMDIHATSLQIVNSGLPITHPIPLWKIYVACAMAVLGLLMWALNKRKFIREQLGNFSNN